MAKKREYYQGAKRRTEYVGFRASKSEKEYLKSALDPQQSFSDWALGTLLDAAAAKIAAR